MSLNFPLFFQGPLPPWTYDLLATSNYRFLYAFSLQFHWDLLYP